MLPSVDKRVVSMMLYRSASLEVIMLETYPLLFAVDCIDTVGWLRRCRKLSSYSTPFQMDPQPLPLSYEYVQRSGVYLMDSGTYVYLYVRCDSSPAVLNGFFGVAAFTQIDEDVGHSHM